MKQLTVIATIFLPLSFITGFFGQNFGFMITHITHEWAFWVLGVGSMLATCAGYCLLPAQGLGVGRAHRGAGRNNPSVELAKRDLLCRRPDLTK